jgi:hypothetical protein
VTNLDTILTFLVGHGLTRAQAAGVAGNLQIESNFSPTAANPKEGAIGIAQWEGGRRTALRAYAAKTGGKETDLNTQLGYLWQELQGPEHGAYVALQQATSASAAAAVFDAKFERSSGGSRQARIDAANKINSTASGTNWFGSAGDVVSGAVGNATDAVSAAADSLNPVAALTNLFGGWQGDVLSIGLKALAGTAAAALVVAGVWSAVHDDNGGAAQ